MSAALKARHDCRIPRDVRLVVTERANGRCEDCGASSDCLETHHLTYERAGGGELPEDLLMLCPACHAARHGRRATGITVPPFVVAINVKGCTYHYFRTGAGRQGGNGKRVRIKGEPGSAEFTAAYEALLAAHVQNRPEPDRPRPAAPILAGEPDSRPYLAAIRGRPSKRGAEVYYYFRTGTAQHGYGGARIRLLGAPGEPEFEAAYQRLLAGQNGDCLRAGVKEGVKT